MSTLDELMDALSDVVKSIGEITAYWPDIGNAATTTQVRRGRGTGTQRPRSSEIEAFNKMLEARTQFFAGRTRVTDLLRMALSRGELPTSLGIPASTFAVKLRKDLEAAWHLCRFVHVYSPGDKYPGGDDKAKVLGIRDRLPKLFESLREKRLILGYAQEASALDAASRKIERLGNGDSFRVDADAEISTYLASPMGKRNEWLREQRAKHITHKRIISMLKTKPKFWSKISTSSGINCAISRHCKRTGIELPPAGKRGCKRSKSSAPK